MLSHRRSTTVSLETYPLYSIVLRMVQFNQQYILFEVIFLSSYSINSIKMATAVLFTLHNFCWSSLVSQKWVAGIGRNFLQISCSKDGKKNIFINSVHKKFTLRDWTTFAIQTQVVLLLRNDCKKCRGISLMSKLEHQQKSERSNQTSLNNAF